MKKFTLTFALALSLALFTSCTVDELEQNENPATSKMGNSANQFNNNKNGVDINVVVDSLKTTMEDPGFEIDPPKPYPKPE